MLTLILITLAKTAAFLPSLRRAVRRCLTRSAVRQLESEKDLRFRARWDINSAKRLRRHLADRAQFWDRMRRDLPRMFDGHPELGAVHEMLRKRAYAELAELDTTIGRIYGATGTVPWQAHEAAQRLRS